MRTHLFLLTLMLSSALLALAQNSARILAPNYFTTSLSPLPTNPAINPIYGWPGYNGQAAKSSQNIQMDGSGQNILFFIIDNRVYARDGQLIGALMAGVNQPNSNYGAISPTGEILIVPSQTCKNEFFVFGSFGLANKLQYAGFYDKITVAYDENNNLITSESGVHSMDVFLAQGGVTSLLLQTLIGEPYAIDPGVVDYSNGNTLYAAAKANSNASRFVYVLSGRKIHRLKIQNGTVLFDNYTFDISTLGNYANAANGGRQEMELITLPNGNYRIAIPFTTTSITSGNLTGYMTLDFNGTTGSFITGTQKILSYNNTFTAQSDKLEIKGAEMSSDGRYLFLTHNKTTLYNSSVDVFDLNATNPSQSRIVISTSNDYTDSQLEIDMTGGILMPAQTKLSRINIVPGSGNTFTFNINPNVISLPNYSSVCPYTTTHCSFERFARLMQDQIDDENYGNYGNYITGVISHNVTSSVSWSPGVASNLTTGNTIYIEDNITVKAGATLEINNMTLKFSPNARLIIENSTNQLNGGRVVLTNGSKLTYNDQCAGQMWRGVEVHGDPSQPQGDIGNTKQASILVSRNSIIEHAYAGITAGKYSKIISPATQQITFLLSANSGGGIIETSSATFFNNIRDILFTPYFPSTGAINKSKFSNTTFKTTGALNLFGAHPVYHVELRRVNGIKFEKCDFINTTPDVYDLHKRGVGIFSSGSSFNVKKRCLSPIPSPINCSNFEINTFTNLHIGIYNSGVLTGYPSTSESAQFTNNNLGIYDISGRNNRYINNQFTVAKIAPNNPSGITQTAGIYMRAATGYKVEGNVFNTNTTQGLSLANSNPFGVVVNNSGIVANEIYRNNFNHMRIGGQSERINGSTVLQTGLQWKCNTFTNTLKHDLTVLNGRIASSQGSNTQIPGDTELIMKKKAANNQFSLAGEDPQNTSLRHDILCQSMDQAFRYVHLEAPLHIPDSYTPNVLPNKGVIPVQQFFNNTTVKPDVNVCPSKILNFEIINWVQSVNPIVNELNTVDNQIAALTGNESNYEILLEAYSYKKSEIESTLNELIGYFSQDSVPDRLDSLFELMRSNVHHPFIATQLIEMYLFNGNLNQAYDILNASTLSSDEMAFYTLLLSIASETNNFSDELTALHLEDLSILSQNISDEQIIERIQGILASNQQEIIYSFLEASNERSQLISDNEQTLSAVSSQFKVYPNPSVGSFRILNTSEEKEEYVLTIKNILGQTVWTGEMNRKEKFINIESKDAGIYIVEISKKSGEITESIKIVKN